MMQEWMNAHQNLEGMRKVGEGHPLQFKVLISGEQWGPHRDPQATSWPEARGLLPHSGGLRALALEHGLTPHAPASVPQMNGTRPGTASSKLSPWDKSSQSAHRVDLSPV